MWFWEISSVFIHFQTKKHTIIFWMEEIQHQDTLFAYSNAQCCKGKYGYLYHRILLAPGLLLTLAVIRSGEKSVSFSHSFKEGALGTHVLTWSNIYGVRFQKPYNATATLETTTHSPNCLWTGLSSILESSTGTRSKQCVVKHRLMPNMIKCPLLTKAM